MNKFLLLPIMWLFISSVDSTFLMSQTPRKIKEFSSGKIESVSVDRLGNFFLIFKNGSIKKYDPDGRVIASLKKDITSTLIEPWFHPKIFSYYRSSQQYLFYNHDFEVTHVEKIDASVAVNPWLVCPTNDNKLLVLDEADWSVKKINETGGQVLSEFDIDTTGIGAKPDFSYIKEYQNLIFLLEKKSGIHIFSNLGKKVNSIKTSAQNFGFFGEELFYLSNDRVIFYDLYTEKNREVKLVPGRFVIVTDERIILVKENSRVMIYEFVTQETQPEEKKE